MSLSESLLKFQGIVKAMCRGLGDSLKGALVLYYLDKQINEKLKKTSSKMNSKKRLTSDSQSSSTNSKEPR